MAATITIHPDPAFTGKLDIYIHSDGSVTTVTMDAPEAELLKDPDVLALLARHEAATAGTPSRDVVRHAVQLGYDAKAPGGTGQAKYVRLIYSAPSHKRTVTLYIDSVKIASGGKEQWEFALSIPGREPSSKDIRFYYKDVDYKTVLQAFKDWADAA
ncbi:hypothetical protein SAMN05660657_05726 [Geodermatophilus amargosae]|uniref:Uncharacterized protein n=1 Tax=Geodermatophilus amargosae TaxID=1296565 RepID=A0A1I7DFV6_9ACTN|nr:hypothetical protein [Geodermatophilus amargosae]SFU10475.1 hypothetical protein SAMN05660657_05726 [Geodermatophilus amargosae]